MFWTKNTPATYVPKSVLDSLRGRFTAEEIEQMDRLGTLVELDADTTLTTEGRLGDQAFILVAGKATVERDGDHIADIGPGGLVGEISLLSGARRNATVRTVETSTAYAFSPRDFASLLARCPKLGSRVTRDAIRRVAEV